SERLNDKELLRGSDGIRVGQAATEIESVGGEGRPIGQGYRQICRSKKYVRATRNSVGAAEEKFVAGYGCRVDARFRQRCEPKSTVHRELRGVPRQTGSGSWRNDVRESSAVVARNKKAEDICCVEDAGKIGQLQCAAIIDGGK